MRRPIAIRLALAAGLLVAAGVEVALRGLSDGHPVVPLLILVLALYEAGRRLPLAAAVIAAAAAAAARALLDPAVEQPADVVLTLAAALLPVLVGRWMRGQEQLRQELAAKAGRLRRERRRAAAQAAEEERMRIAGDLEVAVTGALDDLVRDARDVGRRLEAGEAGSAADAFGRMAATGRAALADVRRVLGVLRRNGRQDAADEPVESRPAEPVVRAGRRIAARPAVPSWALPAALLVAAAVELQIRAPGVPAALSALLIAVPLLLRVRRPLAAAAGVLAAVAFQSVVLDPDAFPATSIVAIVCAAFAVGARTDGIAGLILFAAGTTLHAALVHPDALGPALVGGALVPWTVGRIVKGRRLLLREARDRAAQAEREREQDARAAITAERMRVARELHDAVAHNLSVVAIQAAGAQGLAERDPARAAKVAELVHQVTEEALVELGRLAGERDRQQPGLSQLDALAERARAGGLPVELTVEGEPKALPAGLDLAAFRIVQEALANASKHAGDATARVVVRYDPNAVELTIEDDGRGPNGSTSARGGGHGLVGMRERAALYHGTLRTGRRPCGGFAVHARLPT